MRRSKKGFIYTLFAFLVIVLLISIIAFPSEVTNVVPSGESARINKLYYFLESVQADLRRSESISARRSMTSLTNIIISNGTFVNDSKDKIYQLAFNGSFGSTTSEIMSNSTLKDWKDKIKNLSENSGYNMTINLIEGDVNQEESFNVGFNLSYNAFVYDEFTESSFNRSSSSYVKSSFLGLEDPVQFLNSKGTYSNVYSSCNYDFLAENLLNGSESAYLDQNWTSDLSLVSPADPDSFSDKRNRILVIENVCDHNLSSLEDYEGVISESEASPQVNESGIELCGNQTSLESFIGGAENATQILIDSKMTVMNENQIWVNNLFHALEESCYFEDSSAPNFFHRFEGKLTESDEKGISFLIDVTFLPSELQQRRTAVDYLYWNNASTVEYKLKGVTDHNLWFRLDQEHISKWNISRLSYN